MDTEKMNHKKYVLIGSYLLKRLGASLIVLALVSFFIFMLIRSQPGNPYLAMMDAEMSQEQIEEKLREKGFYDPLPIQYVKWVRDSLKGDLGYSIYYKTPVMSMIKDRMKNTVLLSGVSFLFATAIAIVLGVYSASKVNKFSDFLLSFMSFLGTSLPAFFLALLLIKYFAYDLTVLPPSGIMSTGKKLASVPKVLDIAKHMILPVTVLTFTQSASMFRYIRSSMISSLNEDFIKTARAKGLSRAQIIWKHGLAYSVIRIITVCAMQLPSLLSGAIITESVFVWPGMGLLGYEAVKRQDYPLIMGVTLIIAVVVIASNFIADILYSLTDPRIREIN